MMGENFGGQEILQIFVIYDNVYKKFRSFQIVTLGVEMEYNWMNFLFFYHD